MGAVPTPLHRYVYDSVQIGDVRDIDFGTYDLILLCDVLEHMTKDDALKVFARAVERSKAVIVTTPVGHSPQGVVMGNPFEEHKCGFSVDDFPEGSEYEEFDGVFALLARGKRT